MTRVYNHSASVLVMPEGMVDRLLLGVYDGGYHIKVFRMHVSPLGGISEGDDSPALTLRRELLEELGSASPYAEAILENMQGYGDYLQTVKAGRIRKGRGFTGLASVYTSKMDRELFKRLEEDVLEGMQTTTEGFLEVVALDDLVKGRKRCAWGYGRIISDILGIKVPEYGWIKVVPLGRKPMDSFADYKREFEYEKDPEK